MTPDSQIQSLIDSMPKDDKVARLLQELVDERRRTRLAILSLRDARDFFRRQTELEAFKCQ